MTMMSERAVALQLRHEQWRVRPKDGKWQVYHQQRPDDPQHRMFDDKLTAAFYAVKLNVEAK